MDNFICVSGNSTRPVELRFLPSGGAVANFGMAVNRKWTNKTTGQTDEEVMFIDVTVFGDMATNLSETLEKGTRVTVTGRLKQENWEDKNGGGKRSKHVIIADDVAMSSRWAIVAAAKTARTEGGSQTGQRSSRPAAVNEAEEPF